MYICIVCASKHMRFTFTENRDRVRTANIGSPHRLDHRARTLAIITPPYVPSTRVPFVAARLYAITCACLQNVQNYVFPLFNWPRMLAARGDSALHRGPLETSERKGIAWETAGKENR